MNKEKYKIQNSNENKEQNNIIYNYTEGNNNNFSKISYLNKSILNEESNKSSKNNKKDEKKKKLIFKIKKNDDMKPLIINKGDDVYYRINKFYEENKLDEEDKEQIIEAVNSKLLGID